MAVNGAARYLQPDLFAHCKEAGKAQDFWQQTQPKADWPQQPCQGAFKLLMQPYVQLAYYLAANRLMIAIKIKQIFLH